MQGILICCIAHRLSGTSRVAPSAVASDSPQDCKDAGLAFRPPLPVTSDLRNRAEGTSCLTSMLLQDLQPAPAAPKASGSIAEVVHGPGALPVGLRSNLPCKFNRSRGVRSLHVAAAAGPQPGEPPTTYHPQALGHPGAHRLEIVHSRHCLFIGQDCCTDLLRRRPLVRLELKGTSGTCKRGGSRR